MILFKTATDLQRQLSLYRENGRSVGFVPTMGALHAGHISLVEHSKQNSNITVASIFVNPTQFNDPEDFARYPVTIEQDLLQLEKAGCDVVFLPTVQEVYPQGTQLTETFELGYLETILEGKFRPGHFQGVCQVVKQLLEIVAPDSLFLGRKDYQQVMVIKKLIELSGWDIGVNVVPTFREPSGLAMSSRNMRLSEEDKQKATAIHAALQYIQQNIRPGVIKDLIREAEQMILRAGFEKIDYVAVAKADSLEETAEWDGHTQLVALAAAFIGGVRLIDNVLINGN